MPTSPLTSATLWAVRVLSLAAVILSSVLLDSGLAAEPTPGCGWETFDCDAALASRWAKWFGLPVAAAGAAMYLAIHAAAWMVIAPSAGVATAGWRVLEAGVVIAAGAALWFVGVQMFALESYCVLCLATHACGLLIAAAAVTVWLRTPGERAPAAGIAAIGLAPAPAAPAPADAGPPPLGLPTALGAACLVALAGGQLTANDVPATATVEARDIDKPIEFRDRWSDDDAAPAPLPTVTLKPTTPDEPRRALGPPRREGGSRVVRLLQGQLKIDAYDHPVLGSPEADHVLVELMDYACPHCREFHEIVTEALERFDGRVAVVVLPVPGELLCNPFIKKARPKSRGACGIAKVSLAAALLAPEDFAAVHAWLLDGERLPEYTSALVEAQKHVDPDRLSTTVRDKSGRLQAKIEQNANLMASLYQSGKVGLPAQLFPDRVVSGPVETVDGLCELWTREFGVRPTDDTPLPF